MNKDFEDDFDQSKKFTGEPFHPVRWARMVLGENQLKLFDYVKQQHGDQVRKYTGEPYYNHLYQVAELASQYEDGCVEVALCHDLFEDTKCDFNALYKAMADIGYDAKFAYKTCTHVKELTDEFTHEKYPYFNRDKRKLNEAARLGSISYLAQTVKYADLINNTSTIVQYDHGFARKYLQEKERILQVMTKGNPLLFQICSETLTQALNDQQLRDNKATTSV
mgnify:CR=1 FL=1